MSRIELERAVITAARSWSASVQRARNEGFHGDLADAIDALEEFERAESAATEVIGWHEIAEGDELLSPKNGRFYRVTNVLAITGGKRRISLDQIKDPIIRPTPAEPTATVCRGPAGRAVSAFVNVFSSGES